MTIVATFARDTITRIRPGIKDSRGTPIPDWENTETVAISGCTVQPGSTKLDLDGRVLGITDGMTAYIPATADVQAGDRIGYKGETYTIDGEPRRWPSATGNRDHIQLNLKRWSG